MPTRGPCPNVGITRIAVPAHDDHTSPNRKQRLPLKQVEIPMSQMGRMSFVAAGVMMGKGKKPNGGNPCIDAPRCMILSLTGRTPGGWSTGECGLNKNQNHDECAVTNAQPRRGHLISLTAKRMASSLLWKFAILSK